MRYVYPKFSKYDFCLFRLGGAGLGNLLFIYARALIYAKRNNFELIWPTWVSFKIGPYIRREKDKRLYNDLFSNNSGYIHGFKKCCKLFLNKKTHESATRNGVPDNSVVVFDKYIMDFYELLSYREIIYSDLFRNLKSKNKKVFEFDFSDSISIHVRLGDFSKASAEQLISGIDNSRLPIMWYVNIIKEIRKIVGYNIKAYVFSDGTDGELHEILKLDNVERLTFGSSIADIFGLSKSRLLVASGSTFSMWARFLGASNTIAFENQLKCKGLCADDCFEEEVGMVAQLSDTTAKKIRELYGR